MRRYLILAAMEAEFAELVNNMDFTQDRESLWSKSLPSAAVTIAKTGIGPISAAMNLTKILSAGIYDEAILLGRFID